MWTLTVWIQCVQATERLRRAAGEAEAEVWTIWRHLLNLPRLWSFYSDQAAAVQLYLLYAEFLVFSRLGFLNFYIGHGPNLRCRQLVKMSGCSNKTFFGKRGSHHRSKTQQIFYSTANTHWLKVGFQQHQCQDLGTLVANVYCRYNHAESLHEKL